MFNMLFRVCDRGHSRTWKVLALRRKEEYKYRRLASLEIFRKASTHSNSSFKEKQLFSKLFTKLNPVDLVINHPHENQNVFLCTIRFAGHRQCCLCFAFHGAAAAVTRHWIYLRTDPQSISGMLPHSHNKSSWLTCKSRLLFNQSVSPLVIVHTLHSVLLPVLPQVAQQPINAVLASSAPHRRAKAEFVKTPRAAAHRK